jgi:septal ring factor EnvC (AmiA/AmiB activator)
MGFCIPKDEFDMGQEGSILMKQIRDELEPKYQTVQHARVEIQRCNAGIAELEGQLIALRGKLDDFRVTENRLDGELREILTNIKMD